MKKIIILLILLALLPNIASAQFAVPWRATSTTQGWIAPAAVNGVNQTINIPSITGAGLSDCPAVSNCVLGYTASTKVFAPYVFTPLATPPCTTTARALQFNFSGTFGCAAGVYATNGFFGFGATTTPSNLLSVQGNSYLAGNVFVSGNLTGTSTAGTATTSVADIRKKIAKVLVVDPAGNGDYLTISAAVTASVSGNVIFVQPGTYTENTMTVPVGVSIQGADKYRVVVNGAQTNLFNFLGNNELSDMYVDNNANSSAVAFADNSQNVDNVFIHDVFMGAPFDIMQVLNTGSDNWLIQDAVIVRMDYDGGNSNGTNIVWRNITGSAVMTVAAHTSIMNHLQGSFTIENSNITVTGNKAGAMSFVRGDVTAVTYSRNNNITITNSGGPAHGFSMNDLSQSPIFWTYNDTIMLAGTSIAHFAGSSSSGVPVFHYQGGNATTTTGTLVLDPLQQPLIKATSFWATSSSTLQNFTAVNSTTTAATTTSQKIDGTLNVVSGGLQLRNPANTFNATVNAGAQTGNRTYTFPVVGSTEIITSLGTQSVTGAKTFTLPRVLGSNNGTGKASILFDDAAGTDADYTIPDGGGTFMINGGPQTFTADLTFQTVNFFATGNGLDIAFTTAGSKGKIGTAANQLLSFWGAGITAQPANTVAIDTLLGTIGLRATGGIANFDNTASSTNFIASSPTATSTFNGPIDLGSTGTSPTVGNATLVGGTKTVTTGAVTTASFVMLTRKTSGGTIGTAITYTLANGSFTINSDNPLDTSVFTWLVIN